MPPKERFDRVIIDKLADSRLRHLKQLRRLVKRVRALDQQADAKFAAWQQATNEQPAHPAAQPVQAVRQEAPGRLPRFRYKQKVLDEMMLVTENIRDKIQAGLAGDRGAGSAAQVRGPAGDDPVREETSCGPSNGLCACPAPIISRRARS